MGPIFETWNSKNKTFYPEKKNNKYEKKGELHLFSEEYCLPFSHLWRAMPESNIELSAPLIAQCQKLGFQWST